MRVTHMHSVVSGKWTLILILTFPDESTGMVRIHNGRLWLEGHCTIINASERSVRRRVTFP